MKPATITALLNSYEIIVSISRNQFDFTWTQAI